MSCVVGSEMLPSSTMFVHVDGSVQRLFYTAIVMLVCLEEYKNILFSMQEKLAKITFHFITLKQVALSIYCNVLYVLAFASRYADVHCTASTATHCMYLRVK